MKAEDPAVFDHCHEFNRFARKSHARTVSLCNFCVLCVSVVVFLRHSLTTEAQRTQRLHREEPVNPFFGQAVELNFSLAHQLIQAIVRRLDG